MVIKGILTAAIFMVIAVFGTAAYVFAEDLWGCEVLLCLSNPSGPKAVSECVAPINRLYDAMKKPHFVWPTCSEAEAGGSYMRPTNARYDVCPSGFQEVRSGTVAIMSSDYQQSLTNPQWISNLWGQRYLKWNHPVYLGLSEETYGTADMICGKGPSDAVRVAAKFDKGRSDTIEPKYSILNAVTFDQLVALQPFRSWSAVEIYVDHVLYKRVPLYRY